MQETEKDDALNGCAGTSMCGTNGTQLNGIALQGVIGHHPR